MNLVLKAVLLVIYVIAAASATLPIAALPAGLALSLQAISVALLLAHLLELLVFQRYVRLYKGSLAVSVLLTLLFGLLHWKPLADVARKSAA